METIIKKLKSPYTVVKFQNYFGVYRTEREAESKHSDIRNCLQCKLTDPEILKNFNVDCQKNFKENLTQNGSVVSNGDCLWEKEPRYRHRRECSCDSIRSSTPSDVEGVQLSVSDIDSDSECQAEYEIRNKFWYYFFTFGASLGYELFYSSFFPFWFWNIDGAVGRRVIMVWVLIMYVGQALKDIIRWPRPSAPPVVQLEPGYSEEYGMPSTHAMVGAAVPFSLLIFTMHRYEYPIVIGLLIAILWCALVCCSRLYMGMHTILDILGGLFLVTLLMVVLLPIIDTMDSFFLTHRFSPLVAILFTMLLVVFYPSSDRWTPARSDTAIILGSGAGLIVGAWLNYKLGIICGPGLPPPYQILWPDYHVVGLALLRASIGISCIVATRAIFKSMLYAVICNILKVDAQNLKTKHTVQVFFKYLTYSAIGFTITYLSPVVFRFLNIERITMFTEV
ncbi:sphingosine-1-phosphate phosphatase 1-like [Limulus polyphemus]|uniref:Sphingosine-1-phosphate phosphatase 1-like n=1 Tax=Limulus polyphemus TaxID=6850 RepID=A0ABM1BG15_LIMPO|nr:sphingosine-1-phosphate phosphatase 1-like [Limulus polyphemus]